MATNRPNCAGFCGFCYENRKGRSNHRGHVGYRAPPPLPLGGLEMAIRRRDANAAGRQAGRSVVPDPVLARFTEVWAFLSEAAYPDGGERKPGTLTLFLDDGILKACLNDRDQGLTSFVSSETLQGLLEAIQEGLEGDTLEWRRSGPASTRKGRKGT